MKLSVTHSSSKEPLLTSSSEYPSYSSLTDTARNETHPRIADESQMRSTVQLDEENPHQQKGDKWVTSWLKKQGGVPNSPFVDCVFYLILVLLVWSFLLAIFQDDALPRGNIFNIFLLLVLADLAGFILLFGHGCWNTYCTRERLIKLPGLFGMLLTGIILRSADVYHVTGPYAAISPLAREFALAIILTKAGLALDPEVLKKKAFTVIKLSLMPCIGESVVAAVMAHYTIGLPWLWASLLGFVLSPISPAVVVPTLISLKERGYGEDKGISTMVIAASAIDDVFSIVAYGVVLKMIFSGGEGTYMTVINGVLDCIFGIIGGLLWAFCCCLIPNKSDIEVVSKRSAMLGIGGVALVLGTSTIRHNVIGSLGSITASLFANICWCMQEPTNSKHNPVAHVFTVVWRFTEPVLFAMVGAEIDVKVISPSMIGYGVAVLVVGLAGRVAVCYLSLFGTGLNMKEVIFVVLAWLPKATVQAAISAQAMDKVREQANPSQEQVEFATWVLNTAILSIVITAPIGSIAINLLGTKLLSKC